MAICCVAAFVAVHNNAPGPHCQMRVMQSRAADLRKRVNGIRLRLACDGVLAHSPAPMSCISQNPPPSRSLRPALRAGAALLLLLLLGAAARLSAQEPDITGTAAAVATGSGPLETAIVVEKLEPPAPPARPHGRFVRAERLEAGDEVHYTVRVHNPGKAPVTDVQVTKRLPFGLHFVPGSATCPACDTEFSGDGGRTFAARPSGDDHTHVRWTLRRPLPPGATALLRFRATFR